MTDRNLSYRTPPAPAPLPKKDDIHPQKRRITPTATVIYAPSKKTELVIGGVPMSSLPSLPGQMGIPQFEQSNPMVWQATTPVPAYEYNEGIDRLEQSGIRQNPNYKGGIIKRVRSDGNVELFRTPKVKPGKTPGSTLVFHPNMSNRSRMWDEQSAAQEIAKAQSAGYLLQDDTPRTVWRDPSQPIRVLPSGEVQNVSWQYPSPFAGGEIEQVQQFDPSNLGKVYGERFSQQSISVPTSSGNATNLGVRQYEQKTTPKISALIDPQNALETALKVMRLEKSTYETPEQSVIRQLGGKTALQMEYEKGLERGNALFTRDENGNRVRNNIWETLPRQSADSTNWQVQPSNANELTNPLATVLPLNERVAEHMQKDLNMAARATQFIGMSAAPSETVSSTRNYQAAWRNRGLANTGQYSPNDVVMVSGSTPARGVGKHAVEETFTKIASMLDKAIAQQSKFVIGNAKGSDRMAKGYLKKQGYQEIQTPEGYSVLLPQGTTGQVKLPKVWQTPHTANELAGATTFQKTQSSDAPLNPVVAYDTIVDKGRRAEKIAGIDDRYVPYEWDRWNYAIDPISKKAHSAGFIYNVVPTKDNQGLRVVQSMVEGLKHKEPAIGGWQNPVRSEYTGLPLGVEPAPGKQEFRTAINPKTGKPYITGKSIVYKLPMSEKERVAKIRSIELPEGAKVHKELNAIQLPVTDKLTDSALAKLEERLSLRGGFPKIMSILDKTGQDIGQSIIATGASHLSKLKPDGTVRNLQVLTPEGADHLYSMARIKALSEKLPPIDSPGVINALPENGTPTVPIKGLQTMRQFLGRTKNEPGLYELMNDQWGIHDLSEAQYSALQQTSDRSLAAQTALDAELALGNPEISMTGKVFAPNVDSIYEPTYLPERKAQSRHVNPDGTRDIVTLPPVGQKTYALGELTSHYPEYDTNKGGRTTLVSEQNSIIDANREVDRSEYNPIRGISNPLESQVRDAADASAIQQVARNLLDSEISNRSSAAQVELQPVVSTGEFRSIQQGLPGIDLPESAVQRKSTRLTGQDISDRIARNNAIAQLAEKAYQQEVSSARAKVREAASRLSDNLPMPKVEGGILLPNNAILADEAQHQAALAAPDWDDSLNAPVQELNSVIQGMRNSDARIINDANPEYLGRQDIREAQAVGKMENAISQARQLGWQPNPISKVAGIESMAGDAENFINHRAIQSRNAQPNAASPVERMLDRKVGQLIQQTMPTSSPDMQDRWRQHWGNFKDANPQDMGVALGNFKTQIQDWGVVEPGGTSIDAPIDAQASREIDRALKSKGAMSQVPQMQQEWASLRGQHSNLGNALQALRGKLKAIRYPGR